MELTRAQVAATLGCSVDRVSWLVTQGRLTPLNRPKDPARRYCARFDDGAVRMLKREQGAGTNGNGTNGHAVTTGQILPPLRARPDSALQTVIALAGVDPDKRELLLKLAARYSAADLALLLDL